MANTTKKKTGHIVLFIVLCLLSVIIAFPFIWMVLSSFKKSEEFYYLVPKLLPESFMLDNFKELIGKWNFLSYYKITIILDNRLHGIFLLQTVLLQLR